MAFELRTQLNLQDIAKIKTDFKKIVTELQTYSDRNPITIRMSELNNSVTEINNVRNAMEQVERVSHNTTQSLGSMILRIAKMTLIYNGLFEVLNQVKDGINTINEIDTKMTNISMINGLPKDQVASFTKDLSEQARDLKDTTVNLLSGAEAFMRAGRSVAETKILVADSTIMSKISGDNQKTISEQMLAIQNSYQFSSEQMQREFVDKISALDSASATSSSDIAQSVLKTAQSAKLAGVSWDFLLASMTSVMDVTKKSGSEVGNSIKNIFSRMQNIAKGVNSEDDVTLNQVEKALNKQGIALRTSLKEWRNMEDVIKDVQAKWSQMSSVDQSEIVSKMGGAYNRESLLVMFENQKKTAELMEVVNNSAGSSQNKYNEYLKSTAGQIAELKVSMEQFWMSAINSSTINSAIQRITKLVDTLKYLTNEGSTSGLALIALGGVLTILIKNFTALNLVLGTSGGVVTALSASFFRLIGVLTTFLMTPVGLAIVAIGIAIGGLTYVISQNIKKSEEHATAIKNTKTAYDNLSASIKNNSVTQDSADMKTLQDAQDKLQKAIKEKTDAQKILDEANSVEAPSVGSNQDNSISSMNDYGVAIDSATKKSKEATKSFNEQTDAMKKSGVAYDETTGEIYRLNEAKGKISYDKSTSSISFYNKVLDEINTTGKISVETNSEIINKHMELIGSLGNEANLREKLKILTEQEQKTQSEAYSNMLLNSQEYYTTNIKNNVDMQNKFNELTSGWVDNEGKAYKANLDGFTTLANLKGSVDAQAINNLSGMWSKYWDNQTQNFNKEKMYLQLQAGTLMNSSGINYKLSDNAPFKSPQDKLDYDIAQTTEKIKNGLAKINSIATPNFKAINVKYTPIGSSYIPSGKSGGSSSSSSSKTHQISDIAPLNDKTTIIETQNDALEKQDNIIEGIKSKISDYQKSKDYTNEIKEQNNLLIAQKEKLKMLSEDKTQLQGTQNSIKKQFTDNGWFVNGQDFSKMTREDFQAGYDAIFSGKHDFGTGEQAEVNKKAFEDKAQLFKSMIDNWFKVGDAITIVDKNTIKLNDDIDATNEATKQTYKKELDTIQTAQDKVVEILKKRYEEEKDLVEKNYNAKKDALEKEKNLYNDKNETDDYNKNLSKEQSKMNDINALITSASRDQSLSGKARLKELQYQKTAQKEVIDNMILDRTRETNNKLFDEQSDLLDKQKEADDKSLDEKYSDENLVKLAAEAISQGFINLGGKIVDIKSAYIDFENRFGSGLTVSGSLIKTEFIDKLTQAQTLIKNLKDINIHINATDSSGGTVPSYAIGTTNVPADTLSLIHQGESIIPASINPFNGSNFINMIRQQVGYAIGQVKVPNVSGLSSSSNGDVSISVPITITGQVTPDLVGQVGKIVKEAGEYAIKMIRKDQNLRGQMAH